jgi:phage-related protein
MVKSPYSPARQVAKVVHYLPPCLKLLKELPDDVKVTAAYALTQAAHGVMHEDAKVQELAISEDGNAFRIIFTVQFPEAIYVLHVFQKKSLRGIATPKREIELVKARLSRSSQWRLKKGS